MYIEQHLPDIYIIEIPQCQDRSTCMYVLVPVSSYQLTTCTIPIFLIGTLHLATTYHPSTSKVLEYTKQYNTVNSEIIACIYYCDFVILNLNAKNHVLINSYEVFKSLHHCVYNPVAFFAIIKTSQ